MTKEGFSIWFKETFHKEDCLNNAVFTRQSLMDAWDNGYNKGKEELKEKLTKAAELLKWALHSDPEHDGLADFDTKWKEAEQFLEEVET